MRVVVNGAKGKVGRVMVAAVEADDALEFAGAADVEDDLAAVIRNGEAGVVIDFTAPSARMTNVKTILESGAAPVVGTTGFTPEDEHQVDTWAREHNLPAVIAPNFSIGAVLMMEFATQAARFMPQAEIVEIFHDQKAEAPSGTAMTTARLMNESNTFQPPQRVGEEFLDGARGGDLENIRIHSVRLPGFVATQEVIFGIPGERLSIKSDAIGRECYSGGVLFAVKKTATLAPGLHTLRGLMGFA